MHKEELLVRETISELASLIPEYRDRLSETEKIYGEGKNDSLFTIEIDNEIAELISSARETLNKISRCVELAKNIKDDSLLKEVADELTGYHEYIIQLEIYILMLIKNLYSAATIPIC